MKSPWIPCCLGFFYDPHIAAAPPPLCTPSRAAFLMGRYPIRSGEGVYIISAASGSLPKEEVTFAKVTKRQGYETALIGKWHLGLNCERNYDYCHHPSAHGFDHFCGITLTNLRDCQKLSLRDIGYVVALVGAAAAIFGTFVATSPDFSCFLMRSREVVEQPFRCCHTIIFFHLHCVCVDYFDRNSALPFLLFFSFIQVHTAMFASPAFQGTSQHGIYGNAVQEIDWSVGHLMQTLNRLNLRENTLVYLTSDQGAHLEEISVRGDVHRGWNGGVIRVPGLLRWTGMLPAWKDIDEPTSNMDIFPTVVKLAGGTAPGDRVIDGHGLMPLLQGKVERSKHEFLFHYCNAYLNAVRWQPPNSYSKWKVFFFTPDFYPENGTACMHTHACFCIASYVTSHDPPLCFDLSRDTEPAFHSVVEVIRAAVALHKESITPVQDQLAPGHLLRKPWLQPCCSSLSQLCRYERDGGRDGHRSTAAADSPQDRHIA
uniref:Steroid sulfatase n=1 Tax=Salmo trutta TaxID=8032 RepID=A0A673W096_SALTR